VIASEMAEITLPGGDWPFAVQMAIVFPIVWFVGSFLTRGGERRG